MAERRPATVVTGPADPADDDRDREDEQAPSRWAWAEFPLMIVVALALALLLKTFVVQAFYIPSASMEPTLEVGDRVLVNKLSYVYREPQRGEVVVFREDRDLPEPDANPVERTLRSLGAGFGMTTGTERDFIKRIIGLPGDTVEMRDGTVYINGAALPEASATEGGYLSRPDLNDFGPVEVAEDHYFMMGDNRPNSSDSRFGLGQIPEDDLLGRAFVVIWPLSSVETLAIADYDEQ